MSLKATPKSSTLLFFKNLFFISALSFLLTSCATVPPKPIPVVKPIEKPTPPTGKRSNVIHTVAPGETFWRLSQMYDIPVASILKANRLSSIDALKMGQKILVPDAAQIKPVLSLVPSKKWRYIIIHHSATEEGSSLAFHRAHLQKGWDRGVGYHFIIDNGTSGKEDGQIEASPRWIKQEDGAHCKASEMNPKAIGICLVGNFNQDHMSKKQMDSLVYLVSTLRTYYKIPVRNIIQHGHVSGALTDCPGKHFPWERFKSKLAAANIPNLN